MNILGLWYSHCGINRHILLSSLRAIERAVQLSGACRPRVVCCVWEPIADNPFSELIHHHPMANHLGIAMQIARILWEEQAAGRDYDAVCFLEHDVLYPHNYFDLTAEALRQHPEAPGVFNHDYIGLNQTGFLKTLDRGEPPLHQLSMRHAFALEHVERLIRECICGGWRIVEPTHALSRFAIRPELGIAPAVHINQSKPFTSHFNCFERTGTPTHPYWGEAVQHYPAEEHDARG
ncbi:MAG TPA: hypothetical protein VHB77_22300 [Planctomycetaceae bacterium]|nr:hypothetical protein [Planctomycetaceae bacterium]